MAILDVVFLSDVLHTQTELKVILPQSGEMGAMERPYPTVWMLHGGNGDYTDWLYQTSLVRYAQKFGLAVVLPSTYNSFGMDMEYGAPYATFLEQELVDKVRELLPCLSRERDENFAAGVSMGGFAAFRWAMNRPDLFAKAGSFAGALAMHDIFTKYLQGIQPGGPAFVHAFGTPDRLKDTENDIAYMAKMNIQKGIPIPKLYMICGTEDFGFDQNVMARDALVEAGCDLVWKTVPGAHDFDCWDPYVPDFFNWLTTDNQNVEGE